MSLAFSFQSTSVIIPKKPLVHKFEDNITGFDGVTFDLNATPTKFLINSGRALAADPSVKVSYRNPPQTMNWQLIPSSTENVRTGTFHIEFTYTGSGQ